MDTDPAREPAFDPWHAAIVEDRARSPDRTGQRRRWPWVLAVVAALIVAGVASGVAYEQRTVAAQWRDRAVALEAQRDASIERGEDLDEQLEGLETLVRASEDDVVMLEARLRALADEKARAEDAVTTVQVERDVYTQLTGDIAASADLLDDCVERLFDLQTASVDAFNRSTAGQAVDVAPLNARAQDVTAACNQARSAAAAAGAAAERLLQP